MNTTLTKCDHCNNDLTSTVGYPNKTCLELSPLLVPNNTPFAFAVHMEPILDRSYHFCGFDCLDKWRVGRG